MSGPGAPSLCQGPALLLCVGARRFVSGPGGPPLCRGTALCAGARRSFVSGPALLCRGAALLVSGPGALCVGARRFVSGPGAPLCRGAVTALFVSGPGTLRVGARRSFQAPALSVRVCVEPGLFLYRSSALFSALCVGARRSPAVSLCQDPALCVGVCVKSQRCPVVWPGALSVGRRSWRSLSGCVWSPDCFCIGARALQRSLCRGQALSGALSDSGPGARRASAVVSEFVSLFLLRFGGLYVSGPAGLQLPSSARSAPVRHLRSIRVHSFGTVGAPAPIRVTIRRRKLPSACHPLARAPSRHPSSPARSLFPGKNPKLCCWGKKDEFLSKNVHLKVVSSSCGIPAIMVLFGSLSKLERNILGARI